MSALSILVFLTTLNLLYGIYQYYWVYITKKGYENLHEENETLYKFCVRKYQGIWKYFSNIWFIKLVNSHKYYIFRYIRGGIAIILSILVYLLVFYLNHSTTYSELFNFKW